MRHKYAEFKDLINCTITNIEIKDDYVEFITDNGNFCMYHEQDCCESVDLHDTIGMIKYYSKRYVKLLQKPTNYLQR